MTRKKRDKINIAIWGLSFVLAFAFLGAGAMKLAGAEQIVQNFAKWGLPDWGRYLVGGIEVIAALAILFPRGRFYGAAMMVSAMIGAVFIHLSFAEYPMLVPPLVLLILSSVVAIRHRRDFFRLFQQKELAEQHSNLT